MKTLQLLIICAGLMSCTSSIKTQHSANKTSNVKPFYYLALGDSYTVGELVSNSSSWPMQLSKKIKASGKDSVATTVIAKTGWRADELFNEAKNLEVEEKFDLITIQIGVNNQFQNKSISEFKASFLHLIELAMGKAKNGTNSIVIVSIPDYSVSPFADKMDKKKIKKEINEYNMLCKEIAGQFEIKFINITDLSQLAKNEPELFTKDKLHPAEKMYSMWTERIFSEIKESL
ncbi:MAG: SGNH/GDSL hydrolase family protein [Bacteroidetes bacterium]|nr:SGNH/GDSL hydrolase family protein [Bacteroidota bacterium]